MSHEAVAKWPNAFLPQIVDRLAAQTPSAPYGLWPASPVSFDAGFRTISYAQLANVVNGLSRWLFNELGKPPAPAFVAYVGPNDVRLCALALACIKTGYGIFLTSPRNSYAAQKSLFEKLACRVLVTTDPAPPSVTTITEAADPQVLFIPSVDDLLDTQWPPYVYDKSYEEARSDPLFVIHTSGSTGIPKPLVWTQEVAVRHFKLTATKPPAGCTSTDELCHGKRVLVTLPQFHGAGLSQYLLNAIPFGSVIIAAATSGIPTAQGVVDALKHTTADVAILVPSIIAELADTPALLDFCASRLELILYIGGDLPQAVADVVGAKIRLQCQWGASEVGIPPQILPLASAGAAQSRYTRFDPVLGAAFDQVADGSYELVIRRDARLSSTQPTFAIRGLDELEEEYRTKDLFAPHPTEPGLWSWRARADDIIVFLNGEKTNPISMEQHVVSQNAEISAALVVGTHRFQAALIIEPTGNVATTAEQAALIERVWPSIQAANEAAPAHARVAKALVLVADRPLIRAGKGTIQRAATLDLFADAIDRLYANADIVADDEDTLALDPRDRAAVAAFVNEKVLAVTGWSEAELDGDFFLRGMDSLQALQLVRALRRLRGDLGLPAIYQNPSVSKLSSALVDKNDGNTDGQLESLLATYSALVDKIPPREPATQQADVILTGSTGTLGTYLLHALLSRPSTGHVYCLNRREASAAQAQAFSAANLDLDASRVTFYHVDLAAPSLGLAADEYDTLRRAGLIIHNAWPVNFNLGVSAFQPHLAGLVNLMALPAKLVFISSVGAAEGLPGAPESMLDLAHAPSANGYVQSKFIAEHLCGDRATVVRLGQVSGPVRRAGMWNRGEWVPAMVISSVALRCVPDTLGRFGSIDWVPVDLAADVILDVSKGAGGVYNVRNPRTTTWDALLPAMTARGVDVVSPKEWLARLEEYAAAASAQGNDALKAAAGKCPAIKLADFYKNGVWVGECAQPMMVDRTVAASAVLRDMDAVSEEWMRKWVGEWMV